MPAVLLSLAVWIGTWSASPASYDPTAAFTNQTLREIVHVSIGGSQLRVRLTNRFGDAPLVIGKASVATAREGSAAATGETMHPLTFSGSPSVTIPPRADVLSDAVPMRVAPESNVLVSVYVPGPTGPATVHFNAYQVNYAASGDRTTQSSDSGFSDTYTSWYFLDGIEVLGSPARGAIVAFGDSITDGQGSTVDQNNRWPDILAQRMLSGSLSRPLGVLNAGISGNRILLGIGRYGPSALARFDGDVLAPSGVVAVIVLLGINDIQQSPHQYDPQRIEDGLAQIALRAHAHGLHVVGCTIVPYRGFRTYDARGEQTRLAVNQFIRHSAIFDAVADFDAVVRDPNDPHRMRPAYDSGDHLHPNAAAYRAMAFALDVNAIVNAVPR